jgi:predicted DNA-binding transcriptional regulator YafY
MPDWMFISKHALVLSLIAKNPRITALELATAIGTTERQVRRVIADLYDSGYVSKKKVGRGVKYRINPDLSLRHDTHAEIAIGDFLEALGWKRRKKRLPISKTEGSQAKP